MIRTTVALAAATFAVVAAALAPASASAHSGAPWWTAQQAADTVFENDIEWDTGVDTVTYASCRGTGSRIGRRYRHFRCYVEALEDDPYWVLLHTSRSGFVADFLFYD